jgi:nitrate reductase gamma subunit
MSEALHFAEHRLQEVTLGIMAVVYTLRIWWLMRFKPGRDRQASTARSEHATRRSILYSWALIGMPWAMESSRRRPWVYAQFVGFHLGVTVAIGLSFVIPYAPGVLAVPGLVPLVKALTALACAIGCYRLYRRAADSTMRAISSPDDYFSLALLTVWFLLATLAAPNQPARGEGVLLAFFWSTAFFLLYVPFSKISHYLYYPFTRFYFGKTMGYRGVYPLQRGAGPRSGSAAA